MSPDVEPIACTAPKCEAESLWSSHGLVGGRYESQCLTHALRSARRDQATAAARLAALSEIEVPGQLELLS